MENLFRFIIKYHLTLLFIILEAEALIMVHQSSLYKNTVVVEKAENIRGSIKSALAGVENYFLLRGRNEELSKENLALIDENMRLKSMLNSYREDYEIFDTVQKYGYVHAHVVDITLNRKRNTMILDAGREQGIERDMGVISADGIVGIVDRVGDNFCTVVSLLNPAKEVSAKFKESGTYGPLVWDGTDIQYTDMTDIPSHTVIGKGDSIVTSGHSMIFPEGIFIGTVDTFLTTKTASYKVRIKLNNNFRALYDVYIIKDFSKTEFDMLKNLKNNNKSAN